MSWFKSTEFYAQTAIIPLLWTRQEAKLKFSQEDNGINYLITNETEFSWCRNSGSWALLVQIIISVEQGTYHID